MAERAYGKLLFEFQRTRFTLADITSRLQVGWPHRTLQSRILAAPHQLAHRLPEVDFARFGPANGD
jgi:hypothetical protein